MVAEVVADGHVAAVVVDPGPVRVLERGVDGVEGGDLVRREHRGVGQGDRLAEVEDVGGPVGPLELVGRVDLLLAVGVGLGRVDLNAVLGAERLDDLAIVGPVRRQRDDVQLTLRLGRGDEGVHPAEGFGRGRGGGTRRAGRCRLGGWWGAAGARQDHAGHGGGKDAGTDSVHGFPSGRAKPGRHAGTPAGHSVARHTRSPSPWWPRLHRFHRVVTPRSLPGRVATGAAPAASAGPGSSEGSGCGRGERVEPSIAPAQAERQGADGGRTVLGNSPVTDPATPSDRRPHRLGCLVGLG
jgi:hypothetical protein